MPTGRIFDIQHCSLDDGPGIRTTIFFKGCNLSCRWCHNPESIPAQPLLAFKLNSCRGCGLCAQLCRRNVHKVFRDGDEIKHEVEYDNCTLCGDCVDGCLYGATEIVGRDYTLDELLKEVRIDFPYYSVGEGGGVTFSGGEPLLQVDFIDAFISRLEGIHTCIETAGHVPESSLEKIIAKINLFLFDYKVTDPKRHIELCGVDNSKILQNLDFLYQNGAAIILRFPLIPGVNDDDLHLAGISTLMEKYPRVLHGEIMPYHNLGSGKQAVYQLSHPILDLPNTAEEQKNVWTEKLEKLGVRNIRMR